MFLHIPSSENNEVMWMKYREIGSEYEYVEQRQGKGMPFPVNIMDFTFVFSGRTAIETILKNETSIKKATLPSYCCDSMIEPFRRAGIEVDFYPVYFDERFKIDISVADDTDCILWCNYFGFNNDMPNFQKFKKKGGIIIEDITHSLYSRKQYHNQSDYLVASIRKWNSVLCGGYCAAVNSVLLNKPEQLPDDTFLFRKRKAMQDKSAFLHGDCRIKKAEFLSEFSEANEWLAKNYSGLTIDSESYSFIHSVCMDTDMETRRKNAKVLYEGLNNNRDITFLLDIEEMDCPLFVPVIIHNGKRDVIRKKLIDKEIYCPIHWPKPKAECESNIYDTELSLICDQRYNEEDMNRIVEVLNN